MKKTKNGFTLIELLSVIIILSVIIVLTMQNVLNTANEAKKEAFFIYGQNLEIKATSKFIQDQDNDGKFNNCKIYDIKELYSNNNESTKDKSEYEGWVKVSKELINSEIKVGTITLDNTNKNIEYVKYCITEEDSCKPDKPYKFNIDDNKIIVSNSLIEKQTLCANYSLVLNNEIIENQGLECISYKNATDNIKDTKYTVTLTYKNKEYAVENFKINSTATKKDFYEVLNNSKNKVEKNSKLEITKPICNNSENTNELPIEDENQTSNHGIINSKLEESNASLSVLIISGYVINFDPSVYEYTLKVSKLDPLLITAEPKSKKATVSINGNENLKDGSTVKINVESANKFYKKTYKIVVKLEEDENQNSKYIRNIAIVFVILTIIITLISIINKKKILLTIKK